MALPVVISRENSIRVQVSKYICNGKMINANTTKPCTHKKGAVNTAYRMRFGRPAPASTWPAQTALSTRLPIDHGSSIQVALSIDRYAHRVSLVLPRAGRTTFLRQVGRPSRSITSTTPCAPLKYNTNRSAAFVCPFRVSARASLPTRPGHTKAAPTPRAGQPARKATRKVRCLFLRADDLPVASYRRPRSNRRTPPSHLTMRFANYKPERGVHSDRCEARSSLISPRSDSTPLHHSAPGTGAQTATLRLVMEPAEKGQGPRQGYASRPSVFLLTPYGPTALQRSVRIAAYCSFTGQ